MRITRKTYEKARTVVEKAREQIKLVKAWEDAIRRLGNIGNQELVAITVSEGGVVKTECELVTTEVDATVSESKPQ
jgi:hypothetical protein